MNAEHERQKLLHEFDGRKLARQCEQHGATGRWGAGDHRIETFRGSMMVIPARTIGHGLQCKIVRWMFAVGLAVAAVIVLLPAMGL